jgi:hypothetical protein
VKRTRGPFREGKPSDSIVSDHLVTGLYAGRGPLHQAQSVDYYDGHLIAESIAPENMPYFLAALNGYGRLRWAFALVTVSLLGIIVAGGLWLRGERYARGYAAGYERGSIDIYKRAYAVGREEGTKLAPRQASAPEIGALVLCRTALAEAEGQASECGAAIEAGEERGWEAGYGLGRSDWAALPVDCPAVRR